ncbi:MAG: hypothetical protein JWQ35_264 [Bacteriovoracaceae bacterium]|nr:hypothetical protein [Bacteriovoracaceae bacterium]
MCRTFVLFLSFATALTCFSNPVYANWKIFRCIFGLGKLSVSNSSTSNSSDLEIQKLTSSGKFTDARDALDLWAHDLSIKHLLLLSGISIPFRYSKLRPPSAVAYRAIVGSDFSQDDTRQAYNSLLLQILSIRAIDANKLDGPSLVLVDVNMTQNLIVEGGVAVGEDTFVSNENVVEVGIPFAGPVPTDGFKLHYYLFPSREIAETYVKRMWVKLRELSCAQNPKTQMNGFN